MLETLGRPGFWTFVLDALCKGGLLLLLGHLGDRVLRWTGSPAAVRRAGWATVMGALLLLPFSGAFVPQLPLGLGTSEGSPRSSPTMPAVFDAAKDTTSSSIPGRGPTSPPADGAVSASSPSASQPPPASPSSSPVGGVSWGLLLGGIWAAGVLILLVRAGAGAWVITRLRRRAHGPPPAWQEAVDELARRLGPNRSVQVRMSDGVSVPIAVGLWRPTVLLPPSASEWSAQRRRMVLRHELLHFREGDLILRVLAMGARALHWPNPLAWTAWTALRDAQEAACDEAMLRAGADASEYARQLVRTAREVVEEPTPSWLTAASLKMARPVRLEQRVDRILTRSVSLSPWGWKRAVTGAVGLLGLVLCIAALRPLPDASYPDRAGLASFGMSSPAPPSGARVQGQLLGPDGTPVPDAQVHVQGPSAADSAVTVSPSGRFKVHLREAGQHYLWVDEPAYRDRGTIVSVAEQGRQVRWRPRLEPARTGVDSSFAARIEASWDEIARNGGVGKADSLQRAFADRFYAYYRAHPDTRTGLEAVNTAFTMWGNTGSASRVEDVLSQLGPHSQLWKRGISHGLNISYGMSDQKTVGDLVNVLRRLRDTVANPEARAAIFQNLGALYQRVDSLRDTQRAVRLQRRVVQMGVDSALTEVARENIREINNLGVGMEAPDFSAQTLSGRPVSLSDLRGDVVILWFWTPSEGYPEKSIPILKDLRETYRDDGLRIIGIARSNSTRQIRQSVQSHDIPWPQIQEEVPADSPADSPLARQYNARALTSAYVVDRQGRIAAKHLLSDEVRSAVREIMSG